MDVRTVGLSPDLVPYARAWELQRQQHARVVSGGDDVVLLLEHEAVYTAGARTLPHERPADGTPVIDVDRGGKITWHGPGQLVGYPIMRLAAPVDVVAHVRRLERVLIDVVAAWGVQGHQIAGRSGVWVGAKGSESKVAAIGVRVQNGVTMHGFALNCSNDLAPFDAIVPCGIADAGVTTLSLAAGREITPAEAMRIVARRFSAHDATEAAA